jgi:hypothetical protein
MLLNVGGLNSQLPVPSSFTFPQYQSPTGKVISDANGDRYCYFDIELETLIFLICKKVGW